MRQSFIQSLLLILKVANSRTSVRILTTSSTDIGIQCFNSEFNARFLKTIYLS